MNESYGRDLDLNLLRVFVVVAETGSVTRAAARLYLTQPAISAALRRLATTIGAPLFARHGRGVALTDRGQYLLTKLRPNLLAIIDATLAPPKFDPTTSERTLRLGCPVATEQWLLSPLLRVLEREAPKMRLIVLPIHFRNVAETLAARRVDAAVTVADDLPANIRRRSLFTGTFVCLHDPRHSKIKSTALAITEREYFDKEHVVVSYNGDLRGVVEDDGGGGSLRRKVRRRRVRCSVASFANIGAIIEGTNLLATIPGMVAMNAKAMHPRLRIAKLPFTLPTYPMELLWPSAVDEDDACKFLRTKIVAIGESVPSI